MGSTTICHGCGQKVEVPEDYQRTRMRCPECGVMCDVPPPEARKSSPKRRVTADVPQKSANREPQSAIRAPKSESRVPEAETRKPKLEGQRPKAEMGLPIPLAPDPVPAAPPPPPPEEVFGTDEDDGKPYRVVGGKEKRCPDCAAFMRPEEKQCPRCGFDLVTRKKPTQTFTPVERSWEAGWPLRKRRNFFILGLIVASSTGFAIAYATEAWAGYIASLIFFVGMTLFLLGTYARIDLSRNKRGRVTLTKTWRVFFVEQRPNQLDLLEFEGVRTGVARFVNLLDWLICFMLFGGGIIGGVLWWYFFINMDQHFVALLKDHGYPAEMLYQGTSEDLAKDIATTLRDVAGLPYEHA
jgi:hypothetical protein